MPIKNFLKQRKPTNGKNDGNKKYQSIPLSNIKKGPPFVNLFPIKPETLSSITEDMRANGFDSTHPLIIWQEANLLIDGHTRCKAAEEAGIEKIPVLYESFEDVDSALKYAYGLQFRRRNLTDADRFHFSINYLNNVGHEAKKSGWKKKELSAILSVSTGTAQKYISVIGRGTEKSKKAVSEGRISINSAYNTLLKKEKGKQSHSSSNNPKKIEPEPKLIQISEENVKRIIDQWYSDHLESPTQNNPYIDKILGVVTILPDNCSLKNYINSLIFQSLKEEV